MTGYPAPDLRPPAPEPVASAGMPGWFWLLPLIALSVWWPFSSFWASDDFFAMHYAESLGTVLQDFAGPQYGASDLWFFYRPLITLSFWIDRTLAGDSALVALLHNGLFHAGSALLLARIWSRFLPERAAFFAGLLWAVAPGHAGSILWAAGRVDSHTTLWCLLALWALCRHREGRRGMLALGLLAFALALLSKELAFAVPPLAFLLGVCLPPGGAGGAGLRRRLAQGLRAFTPFLLLFGGYLLLRLWALGRLVGGYDAAALQPAALPAGLLHSVCDLLAPLRYAGSEFLEQQVEGLGRWSTWLAWLPVAALVPALILRRRLALPVLAVIAFVVASLPMLPFWAQPEPHNLRYYYLPFAALAGLLACGGPPVWIAALLCWAPAFVQVRDSYARAHREMAAMHRALLVESRDSEPGVMLVAGLPHMSEDSLVVQYHFGVDRILLPPFGPGRHRVLALRPIAEVPGVRRLQDDPPFAVPGIPTWFFDGPDILGRAPEQTLPELRVELEGMPDFSSQHMQELADGKRRGRLRMPEVRAQAYRVTLFTATGYFCCVVPDHGPPDAAEGTIDLRRFFAEARYATAGDHYLLRGLEVPAVLDLDTRFPVLVEAGILRGEAFVPIQRARRLLEFAFDRGLPAFVRGVLGL